MSQVPNNPASPPNPGPAPASSTVPPAPAPAPARGREEIRDPVVEEMERAGYLRRISMEQFGLVPGVATRNTDPNPPGQPAPAPSQVASRIAKWSEIAWFILAIIALIVVVGFGIWLLKSDSMKSGASDSSGKIISELRNEILKDKEKLVTADNWTKYADDVAERVVKKTQAQFDEQRRQIFDPTTSPLATKADMKELGDKLGSKLDGLSQDFQKVLAQIPQKDRGAILSGNAPPIWKVNILLCLDDGALVKAVDGVYMNDFSQPDGSKHTRFWVNGVPNDWPYVVMYSLPFTVDNATGQIVYSPEVAKLVTPVTNVSPSRFYQGGGFTRYMASPGNFPYAPAGSGLLTIPLSLPSQP